MSSGKKLNILVSTLLLALFLYLAFRNVNLEELGNILKNTNYLFVFLGMFVGVVIGSVIRSIRWGILLEPVKKNIPFKNTELYFITIIPAAFIGARIYHVGTNWDYYKNHLVQIPMIWQGGIGMLGAIIASIDRKSVV